MADIRIATRASRLALVQATRVGDLLRSAHPGISVELVEITTTGDRDQTSPIAGLIEVGAFVRSVQEAVLDGRADFAVHSLKDLPLNGPDGLALVAVPERGSPLDVMVGASLAQLPRGAVVGTGSPRRVEQIQEMRPDLRVVELRGNVDTRLRKVAEGEMAAAVMAEAALDRLGRGDAIAQRFDVTEMVPAPGQGALAVEGRPGSDSHDLATAIDDGALRTLLAAERMLLEDAGAGCRSALGALGSWEGERIRLDSFVADERGRRRAVSIGDTAEEVATWARKELGL